MDIALLLAVSCKSDNIINRTMQLHDMATV